MQRRTIAKLKELINRLEESKQGVVLERTLPGATGRSLCYSVFEQQSDDLVQAAQAFISQIREGTAGQQSDQIVVTEEVVVEEPITETPADENPQTSSWWSYTSITVVMDLQSADYGDVIEQRLDFMTLDICQQMRAGQIESSEELVRNREGVVSVLEEYARNTPRVQEARNQLAAVRRELALLRSAQNGCRQNVLG